MVGVTLPKRLETVALTSQASPFDILLYYYPYYGMVTGLVGMVLYHTVLHYTIPPTGRPGYD